MPETNGQHPFVRVLAFDFGLRHIGVAVGNAVSASATPVAVIRARDGKPAWAELDRIVQEWRPDRLLIGLPLNMDGSASPMSRSAERFRGRLQARYHLPCEMVDERLTSFAARQELGAGASKAQLDSGAACLILESWFNQVAQGAEGEKE